MTGANQTKGGSMDWLEIFLPSAIAALAEGDQKPEVEGGV
jgi:hypothetical protein